MQDQVTSVKAGSTRSKGADLLGSVTVLLIRSLFLRSVDGPILSSLYSFSPLRNVKSHFTVRCAIDSFSLLVIDGLQLLYQSEAQDSSLSVESFQYWLAIIATFSMKALLLPTRPS